MNAFAPPKAAQRLGKVDRAYNSLSNMVVAAPSLALGNAVAILPALHSVRLVVSIQSTCSHERFCS